MKTTRIIVAAMLASLSLLASGVAFSAPSKPAPAAKASQAKDDLVHVATCRDGKEYYAPTNEHRGACSGHGGVAAWMDGSPVKAKKASHYR